jgi:hypothetical protein
MTGQSPIVYRVIGNGTCIQAVRLVKSCGNGWHRYVVADSGPMHGTEFNTRDWYANCDPINACLAQIRQVSNRSRVTARCMVQPGYASMNRQWADEIEENHKEIEAILLQLEMLTRECKA